MVVLRIVLMLVVVAVGALVGAWVVSSDRRYLRWAWLIIKLALIGVGMFLMLLAIETLLRAA